MGNKIIKVKDEISHDGDLYTIEDIGSKKRITYSPNEIVQEGTEVGADLLNSFQENLVFKGNANRTTEGQNEVFVSDISGYSEYGEFDLMAQINFTAGNTTETPILRIEQKNYSLVIDVFGTDSVIPTGVLQGLKTIRIRSGKAYILNYDKSLKTYIDNNSGRKPVGYIQDAGNKIAGELYEDKLTTGLFRCIKSGNINYNSSEYFENDSNYALSDKLKNLIQWYEIEGYALVEPGGQVYYCHFTMPFLTSRIVGAMIYDTSGKSESVSILNDRDIRAETIHNQVTPSKLKVRIAYV